MEFDATYLCLATEPENISGNTYVKMFRPLFIKDRKLFQQRVIQQTA